MAPMVAPQISLGKWEVAIEIFCGESEGLNFTPHATRLMMAKLGQWVH